MAELAFLRSALAGPTLLEAAAMTAVFLLLLFGGSMVLPGRTGSGSVADGTERVYKLNGFSLFVAVVMLALAAEVAGLFSLAALHERFAALLVVANVFAMALSTFLFVTAKRRQGTAQAGGGFIMGVDSSPSWLGVDLKLFSYRPSLIGLALLNASFAVVQYETQGRLTLAMMVYQAVTFLYILNYFQFEYGMTRTWDMTSERFGWLLIWGDYVVVPFFYCLPGWWLVDAPDVLSPAGAAAIVLLFLFGAWIFRGANQQKHRFKTDSKTTIWGKPAETLDGRLLVSGFWGIGRHLNYTGEILIYLSFSLTAGFESWVPYLVPVWLASLLWHRSKRDDRRCRAKYGALWERYTQRVRYAMLPFVY
ncbi:MAG: DUF1295 domain-containing protein [Bryobacterales bacterium]|nr:DUF1295 domain-containing protein [Bryobacterales bacterium]